MADLIVPPLLLLALSFVTYTSARFVNHSWSEWSQGGPSAAREPGQMLRLGPTLSSAGVLVLATIALYAASWWAVGRLISALAKWRSRDAQGGAAMFNAASALSACVRDEMLAVGGTKQSPGGVVRVLDYGGTGQIATGYCIGEQRVDVINVNPEPLIAGQVRISVDEFFALPSCSFDIVIMSGVAEYLDDGELKKAFQHAVHVLREGGKLIVAEGDRRCRPAQ